MSKRAPVVDRTALVSEADLYLYHRTYVLPLTAKLARLEREEQRRRVSWLTRAGVWCAVWWARMAQLLDAPARRPDAGSPDAVA